MNIGLEAWGQALLHFLWQGTVLGLVAWAALRSVHEGQPRLRYGIACTFLLLMAAAPLATLAVIWPVPPALPAPDNGVPAGPWEPSGLSVLPREPAFPWTVWASCFWLAGAMVFLFRAAGGWSLAWWRQRMGRRGAPPAWVESAQRLAKSLTLTRRVRVFVSEVLPSPQVFGYFRPVVLLPVAALSGLSVAQVEAILAHEIAHIARHDVLVNYFQVLVESLLFYHPAVWWLSRRIREEREACCDEFAARWCGDRAGYGRALLAFEELRQGPALAATGAPLVRRIRRLLLAPAPGEPVWLVALLGVTLAAGLAFSANDQKPAPVTKVQTAEQAPRSASPAVPAAKPVKPAAGRIPALAELEQQVRELEAARLAALKRQAEIDQKRFDLGVITSSEMMRSQLAAAQAANDAAQVRELSMKMLERARREVELGAITAREVEKAAAEAEQALLESRLRETLALLKQRVNEIERAQPGEAARLRMEELRTLLTLLRMQSESGKEAREREREEAAAAREIEMAERLAAQQERKERSTPYQLWLNQDVVYIIRPEEKAAFERLKTDEEREKFIEQFWQRRDPTPGTSRNETKEEHYRRIAYANERFRSPQQPGWATDRGRMYIVHGPPDEIETHAGARESWRYSGGTIYEFVLPEGKLKTKP